MSEDTVSALIKELSALRVEIAVLQEQVKSLTEYQKRGRENWNKFLWTVGGVVIASLVVWILGGGLAVV